MKLKEKEPYSQINKWVCGSDLSIKLLNQLNNNLNYYFHIEFLQNTYLEKEKSGNPRLIFYFVD